MKKITVLGLVMFAFGCAKGSYSATPISSAKGNAAFVSNVTCDNAIADYTTEAKAEQDPNLSNADACKNLNLLEQKYQGLTCDFPPTTIGGHVYTGWAGETIQLSPCDPDTLGTERAPFLTTTTAAVSAPLASIPPEESVSPDLGYQTKRD
jgi:hypothetical protein